MCWGLFIFKYHSRNSSRNESVTYSIINDVTKCPNSGCKKWENGTLYTEIIKVKWNVRYVIQFKTKCLLY